MVEAGAPGLPVASPSTLSYLASSASLAHADARMFYGCRFKKQTNNKQEHQLLLKFSNRLGNRKVYHLHW